MISNASTDQTFAYLNLLRNHIDITRVPFSDRGSRLLLWKSPEQSCFFIKLAERLTTIQPDIEAYLKRPPFINDLCLIDEKGVPLDFETVISPHIIHLQTRIGDFAIVFLDDKTLAIGLPPNVVAGLKFHVQPQFWETTEGGGVFKSVRNLAYSSTGKNMRNRITPDKGGYQVEYLVESDVDCAIYITIRNTPDLEHDMPSFSTAAEDAESRWRAWFERIPPVADKYRLTYAYAWWIMANNLIGPQGQIAYEAMMPSKIAYVGLWLWDSAMHALAYRYVDPELARNQIRAMLACQLPTA